MNGSIRMGVFIAKRLAYTIPLVLLISMTAFALLHFAPGGPVGLIAANPKVSESDLVRIRENYGLDKPLALQYFYWFRQVFLRFDFGTSYVNGRRVSEMIAERIPATLQLMSTAFVLALLAGGIIGLLSALRRDGILDHLFSLVSVAGMSIPVFWLGLMAIYIFSLKLGIFPAGGRESIGSAWSFADRLRHIALPASVLALAYLASWSRYIREGMIEACEGEFIRTARAKGLSERTVVMKHALRNAVLPAMTVVVMQIPTMFTGAVITEAVFAWPGMGRLFYEGLQRQDHTRVLGVIVISSLLIILFNLISDLLNAAVDPRVSSGISSGQGADRTV